MTQSRKWQTYPQAPADFLGKKSGLERLLGQLLYNRGFKTAEEIENFLRADEKPLHDPFIFQDMGKAVEVIIKHIKAGKKIFIYGDYDADGITSSVLLYDLFSIFKTDPGVYMPDRVSEGYGLNKGAVDKMVEEGASLIITVDTGIRNKEEVDYARKQGTEVIV